MFKPPVPLFVTTRLPAFSTLPFTLRATEVLSFKIVAFPSLFISPVESTRRFPALFVILAVPTFLTLPLIFKPAAPLFVISRP